MRTSNKQMLTGTNLRSSERQNSFSQKRKPTLSHWPDSITDREAWCSESSGNVRSAIYSNIIRESLYPGPTDDAMVMATSLIFERVEREGVQIAKQLCNCSTNEAVIAIAFVNCLPTKRCRRPPRE